MAKEYDNTNKGALFGNDCKRPDKKDPDLQGKLNINGEERWVSGWFFTYEKEGTKRRGINLSLGDVVQQKAGAPAKTGSAALADMSDDIPF
jgi:hypothetical protein